MKRLLSFALAVCMLMLALYGCGDKGKEPSSSAVSTVTPTIKPTATPAPMAKVVRIDADGGLNVRGSASSDGEVLGQAEDDSLLALLVETPKDGWYQVQYEGKSAYVSAEYAKVEEVTLEEYNQLKSGGDVSSSPESGSSSKTEKDPVSSSSSQSSSSSEPVSSSAPLNTEDGE